MTFSINTNNSAMTALQSLRNTATQLATAEKQVSTGLAVGSAADNPAVYAIAQQMNGNISGLAAVSTSLSFGAQVVSTASSASSSIISTLQTLQNSVTTAPQTGISTSTMETAVTNALNQINTYARNSTFNGVNLLTTTADAGNTGAGASASLSVVSGLQGTTLNVANQATSTTAGAVTLTDALGLTSGMGAKGTVVTVGAAASAGGVVENILTSASTGVNIALTSSLAASSFANGKNVVLQNGDGTTTTFEFDASGATATSVNTTGATANKVIVVNVSTGSETSNGMIGDLVNAMNSHGYNAVTQTDGSVNVTGAGVTASTASVNGISSGTTLDAASAAITTIQSAITKMTNITTTLGNSTQQITGMQSFTSDLSDSLTAGVGALTDADLSAESAKLTSLQTKQSLAIQALSIANSQSASILTLFR